MNAMMEMLQLKKTRVRMTEKVADRKEVAIEKVNKTLQRSQRREAYVNRKKEEDRGAEDGAGDSVAGRRV